MIFNPALVRVGVAQWIECQPASPKVTGWIPSLGCRPGPQVGVCESLPIDVSLPLSLPSPLFKK